MSWYAYFRRLAIELVLFFLICTAVFYVVTGQERVTDAIYMAAIATIFYGGMTFILRQRTMSGQDKR